MRSTQTREGIPMEELYKKAKEGMEQRQSSGQGDLAQRNAQQGTLMGFWDRLTVYKSLLSCKWARLISVTWRENEGFVRTLQVR